jgi:aminopeptidase N
MIWGLKRSLIHVAVAKVLQNIFILLSIVFNSSNLFSQNQWGDIELTRADTLRGALSPERICYDVHHYGLNIRIDPATFSLSGVVEVSFAVIRQTSLLQLDLARTLAIDRIEMEGNLLEFSREEDAVFVQTGPMGPGQLRKLKIYYGGVPQIAKNAPWDGGFVWKRDESGSPWVGVACQGDGASIWWPCKDHLSDEPDSMTIAITVPDSLQAISNGRLKGSYPAGNGWRRYEWAVTYPINTYNVTVNVARYKHFSDSFRLEGVGESLSLDYFVLPENLEKARKHFTQVQDVLKAFSHYFGPYPFWNDGYKLVETPYLGMEHQSAIAYGNLYRRGYLGGGIPSDMQFDYIILHETGHEYFGNAVSATDLADMWLHESFTTYMEALYVEYQLGYDAAMRYLMHQRAFIANKQPIIGIRGLNWYKKIKTSDQYYKGAWVLNSMRHMLNDDERWFALLREFYETYKYKTVFSEDFFVMAEAYFQQDLSLFFKQYLYEAEVPELHYRLKKRKDGWHLSYRLEAGVEGLQLPVTIRAADKSLVLLAGNQWQDMWLPIQKEQELVFDHARLLISYKKR